MKLLNNNNKFHKNLLLHTYYYTYYTHRWFTIVYHSLLEAKDDNFGVIVWPLTHSQV